MDARMLIAAMLVAAAMTAWPASPASAAPRFVATRIDPFPGGHFSQGYGINEAGDVTGVSDSADGNTHAFVYTGSSISAFPAVPAARHTFGQAINDAGQVAGYYISNPFSIHAFLVTNASMTDLGTLGTRLSWGNAVNASGQVAGTFGGPDVHAFLYSDGLMHEPRHAWRTGQPGLRHQRPRARHRLCRSPAHRRREPAGSTDGHAFLYSGGTMTDLGTLGGDSTGLALDDSGVVVGSYYDLATRSRRTFIHVEGTMHDLEGLVVAGLDGATLFEATGINSRGQIVANGCRQTVCLASSESARACIGICRCCVGASLGRGSAGMVRGAQPRRASSGLTRMIASDAMFP